MASNKVGECETALQNVATLEIDSQGTLWALDSGTSAIFSRPNRKCSAKLVKFDLKRPKMQIVHVFRENVISKSSVIMHMVLDGNDNFYLADIVQGKIIRFNAENGKSEVIESKEFMRPVNTPLMLDGQLMNLHFGVSGLALQNMFKVNIFGQGSNFKIET